MRRENEVLARSSDNLASACGTEDFTVTLLSLRPLVWSDVDAPFWLMQFALYSGANFCFWMDAELRAKRNITESVFLFCFVFYCVGYWYWFIARGHSNESETEDEEEKKNYFRKKQHWHLEHSCSQSALIDLPDLVETTVTVAKLVLSKKLSDLRRRRKKSPLLAPVRNLLLTIWMLITSFFSP